MDWVSVVWIVILGSLKYLTLCNVDLSLTGLNQSTRSARTSLTQLHLSFRGLSALVPLPRFLSFTSLTITDLSFSVLDSAFPSWLVKQLCWH